MENDSSKINIVILAAGHGTRMQSDLPKVLQLVASQPLLEYSLQLSFEISKIHSSDTTVVVNQDLAQSAQFINLAEKYAARVVIQPQQLGTGHAVSCAIKEANYDLVLVLYADTPFIKLPTISKMIELARTNPVVHLVFFTDQPMGYGRIQLDESGSVVDIVEEEGRGLPHKLCNAGVLLAKQDLLSQFLLNPPESSTGEIYLTKLPSFATGAKCTYVLADEKEVLGINTNEQLARAEELVQKEIRKDMLASGVNMTAPDTVFFARDTKISPGVIIEPYVVFGAGVKIMKSAVIKSFSHLEQVVVGQGAVIGPYARIRNNSVLGDKSQVGNFVEIKNSVLAEEVKAKHLSYIGDAEIGIRSNVGAGTVVCNFNGVNKYKTTVGSGTLIGGNVTIIAPVKIGLNALIAAGSTITEDVPDESLAISRTTQINKKRRK